MKGEGRRGEGGGKWKAKARRKGKIKLAGDGWTGSRWKKERMWFMMSGGGQIEEAGVHGSKYL